MRLRTTFSLAALSIPALSLANGAMGYAFEIFEFRVWAVYVLTTVALEAWIIGRSVGHSWPKSLGLSLAFNAATAFLLCGRPVGSGSSRHGCRRKSASLDF